MAKKSKTVTSKNVTKREQIVDAAIRLFARIPFADISISSIAREAGCGHSLIYHYFANIYEIYEAALKQVVPVFESFITLVRTNDEWPEIKFVGLITNFMSEIKNNYMFAYYIQVFLSSSVPHMTHAANDVIRRKWIDSMLTIIVNAQKSNKVISTLSAVQILTNLHYAIRGVVCSVIFENQGVASLPPASTIYLPYLKGIE